MYSPDKTKNPITIKKSNSCSTIFIDDNTASQPNLRLMLKCVSLAIYYHIKNREGDAHLMDIFDEKLHPLSKDPVPINYNKLNPEHKHVYRFLKTLFSAAQLTAECAIITLVIFYSFWRFLIGLFVLLKIFIYKIEISEHV